MQYGTAYNRGLLFSLRPNIDVERLELAWSTAIDLHSSVKTRIVKASDGKVETRVDPDFKPNVRVMMMDVAEWERLRPRLVAPVDMNMDNDFYRVIIAMVKTPAGVDKYLFVDFHALVCDEMSWMIMLNTAEDLYLHDRLKREQLTASQLAADLAEQVPDAPVLQWWRTVTINNEGQSFMMPDCTNAPAPHQACLTLPLDATAKQVSEFDKKYKLASPEFITTAVMGFVLGRYTNERESFFNLVADRNMRNETADTVGQLENTLPTWCQWEEKMSSLDYVKRVAKMVTLMRTHATSLRDGTVKNIDLYTNDRTVTFAYRGRLHRFNNISRLSKAMTALNDNYPAPGIVVELLEVADGELQLHCLYPAHLYTEQYVSSLLGAYDVALTAFLKRDPLADIVLLDEVQRVMMDNQNRRGVGLTADDSKLLMELCPAIKDVDDCHYYILDTDGNRQPYGAVGALWASPRITSSPLPVEVMDRSISNPFNHGGEATDYFRLFDLGIEARYDSDGNLRPLVIQQSAPPKSKPVEEATAAKGVADEVTAGVGVEPPVSDEPVDESNVLEKMIGRMIAAELDCEGLELSTPLKEYGLTGEGARNLSRALHEKFGVLITPSEVKNHASLLSLENDVLRYLLNRNGITDDVD